MNTQSGCQLLIDSKLGHIDHRYIYSGQLCNKYLVLKVKFAIEQDMKAQRWSRSIALLFL